MSDGRLQAPVSKLAMPPPAARTVASPAALPARGLLGERILIELDHLEVVTRLQLLDLVVDLLDRLPAAVVRLTADVSFQKSFCAQVVGQQLPDQRG
jgi:hypothetical protein